MKRIPTFLAASAATALLLTATASQAPAGQSDFHLELTRSHPAADTVLPSPGEIRLWFSQVPQAPATSLRLTRDGELVDGVGELKPDPEDGKVFAAPVTGTLPEGPFTVSWRTMAADGHVVRGDFTFTVRAP